VEEGEGDAERNVSGPGKGCRIDGCVERRVSDGVHSEVMKILCDVL